MTTTYQYSVRDRGGKLVSGNIDAENETLSLQRLKAMGYAPVSISPANAGMKKELDHPGLREPREAQGAGGDGAAVRDHDQLGPVAAARADDPRGADTEQGTRRMS